MTPIENFKKELWKDQRRLECKIIGETKCLLKFVDSKDDFECEIEVLKYLRRHLTVAQVPRIISATKDNCIMMPYVEGIRIFNLFVELDAIDSSLCPIARSLKSNLLHKCEANQKDIQHHLSVMPHQYVASVYPAARKMKAIIEVLSEALGILVQWDQIDRELGAIDEIWNLGAGVPFRDATTKNMVLAYPKLSLGAFESEEARREAIIESLSGSDMPEWAKAPIVDFDFASCSELSTPEDDPISLLYHERTWSGPPSDAGGLVWEAPPDSRRAAVTFLVRYYRFGGRKAAYRLLHPGGHRVRFRHDNDVFYFARLPSIIAKLWPDARRVIPELLVFTETVARALGGGRPEIDRFAAAEMTENRTYYVDIFPR